MKAELIDEIICGLNLEKTDVRQIPALTLAYLGDAVYEIVIRTMLVEQSIMHVSELNKAAVALVRAGAQKDIFKAIETELTEDELSAFRRGRNVKSNSCAKNASVTDYRIATGFEAMVGYLYLTGKTERIIELVGIGLGRVKKNGAMYDGIQERI